MRSIVYNSDCLEAMRQMPDKAFDLAIVDPPYGIDLARAIHCTKPDRPSTWAKIEKYVRKEWDVKPPSDYFSELQRVSTNQVIWGGNYFADMLPPSRCWLFWDKMFENTTNFSHGELAWTSFDTQLLKYTQSSKAETNGGRNRIHPSQKTIGLYKWVLRNYAKPGDTILDTHLGSGSSRIAAYDLGFDFTAYELDKEYFEAQEKRFANHIAQAKLFDAPVLETVEQSKFEF